MSNNLLEKEIFVIYKTDQQSNSFNLQSAIINKNSIKKSKEYEKRYSRSGVCGSERNL